MAYAFKFSAVKSYLGSLQVSIVMRDRIEQLSSFTDATEDNHLKTTIEDSVDKAKTDFTLELTEMNTNHVINSSPGDDNFNF